MNKEEIYKFGDFVITYDKGVNNDRSCLIISKVDKINIYVLGEIYDESADIINTIINNLQQENKILKENAENNDKVVDKVNWENMLLKKENEQLKDNWNDLKKYTKEVISTDNELYGTDLLDKMQELEKENSNEEGTNNCKNTKLFSYWR